MKIAAERAWRVLAYTSESYVIERARCPQCSAKQGQRCFTPAGRDRRRICPARRTALRMWDQGLTYKGETA